MTGINKRFIIESYKLKNECIEYIVFSCSIYRAGSLGASIALLQKIGGHPKIVSRIAMVNDTKRLLLLQGWRKFEVLCSDMRENMGTIG